MIEGKKYDPKKADIWSLGITLFTLLSGFLPFDNLNTTILYKNILDGNYSFPNFLSDNAKNLIENILNIDPMKRLDLDQIKKHKWFENYNAQEKLIKESNINELVLKKVQLYGFNPKNVKEYIEKNAVNSSTATFKLLNFNSNFIFY